MDALSSVRDRIAIQELSARYNHAADGTDPAPLVALFTHDGVLEMRGGPEGDVTFEGPALERLASPRAAQRVHLTMDSIIELDGDRASQISTLLLVTRAPRRGLAALFTGRYHDELVRTPEGWRFSRRVAEIDYAHEARMTLAAALETA
jgi:hypothetical protein